MRRLKFLILFAWTLGLLGLSLWRFPLPLEGGAKILRALLASISLGLAVLAVGRSALMRFKLFHGSWVEELVFSFALGLVGLSLLGALLEAFGVFYPWVAWSLVAGALIVQWEHLEALSEALWRNLKSKHPWEGSGTELATLLALGLAALTGLVLALAPPTFYDALVYHLANAQRGALVGAFVPQPNMLFSWLPSLPRPLWTWALLLEGQPQGWLAPAFLTLGLGLALGLSLMDTSVRLLSERRLWLAPALALTQPLLLLVFGVFSPDGWMAAFAFWSLQAFLLALAERVHRTQGAWLLLSALLAGAAVACKPVALMHAAALLGLSAYLALTDKAWRRPGLLVSGLGLFLLPLLPWMLQGALRMGQVFYPFPLRFLGQTLSAGAPAAYFQHLSDFGPQGVWKWSALPYSLFFEPASLGGGGHVGFLLLALAPAVLFLRLSRELRWTLAYVLLGLGFWALGPHVLRFGLFLVAPASLLAAQGVIEAEAWAVSRGWTYLWRLLVLVALFFGAAQGFLIAVWQFDPLPVALGLRSPREHLEARAIPQMAVGEWLAARGGGKAKVLVLGDARSAWLPAGSETVSVFEAQAFAKWLARAESPEALDLQLKRRGYQLVLLNLREWERSRQSGTYTALWDPSDPLGEEKLITWVQHLKALPEDHRFTSGPAFAVHLP